jgi:[protein-PII] uridylyltransferase
VAKISTNVDQVADVFYVTDQQGGKIVDPARLEAIREALHRNLAPQNDNDQRLAQSLH